MKYFVLDVHKAYFTPQFTKWHGVLDLQSLREKERGSTLNYPIFQVSHHIQTVFTDILMHPCFMVSKKVMDTIKLYESSLHAHRIFLADSTIKKTCAYYIPILENLDVLTADSRVGRDKTTLEYIEIDDTKTKGKAIFQIENNGKIYVFVHLELVESLLRREVIGIDLREIDITGG